MSQKNNQMSPEELWHAIQEAKTVEAWKQLTNDFNLHVIYTQFRILNDQRRCETYRCGIQKWFLRSLEDYDKQDVFAKCYMADNDGNVHECSTPDHFNCMINDVMKSAHQDGAMEEDLKIDLRAEEEMTDSDKDILPLNIQYAAFVELLKLGGIDYQNTDKSKIINLFCAITGRNNAYVTRVVYQGCRLTPKNKSLITRINDAFKALKLTISIKFGNSY